MTASHPCFPPQLLVAAVGLVTLLEGCATFRPAPPETLELAAGQVRLQMKGGSAQDRDLVAQGGVGADDTNELGVGVEYLTRPRTPEHRPLRLGFRRASLPFPLIRGQDVRETAVSVGTGFRFVGGRAGFDLGLERVWRDAGSSFTETATLLHIGFTVRP